MLGKRFCKQIAWSVFVYLLSLVPQGQIYAQDLNEMMRENAQKDKTIMIEEGVTFQDYIKMANREVETVLHDTELENRQQAHENLNKIMAQMLVMPQADTFEFEKHLIGISVQKPDDGKFAIFTWQFYVDDNTYLYGGYMRMKNRTLFRLDDKSKEHTQPFDLRLRHTNWYGALYYRIMPFKYDGKQMYLLFGYNAHSFFARRKLLDVLYFENDKPRFGYKVIEMKDGRGVKRTVSRFILEYSASVAVTLNYSEIDKMILYDHLVGGSPIEGGGTLNIPDGSYCGLRLEKGKWVYVDKVHEDVYDPQTSWNNPTAPTPNPIFDNKKSKETDIFGKNKKKGK